MRQNKKKLKDLILYVIQHYNNQKLTETKLQKILYFCDFNYYSEVGRSITGSSYRKNRFGPTIMNLPEILDELKKEGLINILKGSNYYGSPQTIFSLANSDIDTSSSFSESEKLVIQGVNESYKNLNPSEISKLSHADFPFVATRAVGSVINYELVYYREGPEERIDLEDDIETKEYFTSSKFATLIAKVDNKLHPKNDATN